MTFAFVSAGVTGGTGTSPSHTFSAPNTGDIIFVCISTDSNEAANLATPLGYVLLETSVLFALYYKISEGNETSVGITISIFSDWYVAVAVYRGSVNRARYSSYLTNVGNPPAGLQPVTEGFESVICCFGTCFGGQGIGLIAPSGYTTRASATADAALVADKFVSGAGTQSPAAVSGNGYIWHAYLVATASPSGNLFFGSNF